MHAFESATGVSFWDINEYTGDLEPQLAACFRDVNKIYIASLHRNKANKRWWIRAVELLLLDFGIRIYQIPGEGVHSLFCCCR